MGLNTLVCDEETSFLLLLWRYNVCCWDVNDSNMVDYIDMCKSGVSGCDMGVVKELY